VILPLQGQVDLPTLFRDVAMRNLAFILLMFCLPSLAMAEPPRKDWTEFAGRMSVGGYTMIGRNPDSKMMYSGRISFDSRGSLSVAAGLRPLHAIHRLRLLAG
jgi:hypothetical protein